MTPLACIIVAALLFPWSIAQTGEQVMPEFKDKRARAPEVLSHVPLKAVVAEFLDPLDSGLGKSLGYLVWREVLTAISDQAGAGVIVAEAPPGERLVDLLERDYHEAAERIGRHQRARMVVWGAVEPEGDNVLIETYLSILTNNGNSGLRLGLSGKVVGPRRDRRPWERRFPIEAAISRKRFNFAPLVLSRKALFERTLVTSAPVTVRKEPDPSSEPVLRLPVNKPIQAIDMIGAWFKIELPGGGYGYIHAGSFGNLRVPPKEVGASLQSVNLRAGPGTDLPIVRTRKLEGRFRVTDMRYRKGQGLWYRLDLGLAETWVAGWLVEPRFSLPTVHFLAGLYRYYGGHYEQGIAAFEQFIGRTDPMEDNVNLATAHQLLGVSQLLGSRGDSVHESFSRAIELTPYDPNAYLLRSVANLGTHRPKAAIDDLENALRLDSQFKPARRLAAVADAIAGQRTTPPAIATKLPRYKAETRRLLERYGIEPKKLLP